MPKSKYTKQPNFYAPDSLSNPEVYAPVIKLMFDIYIQRLQRAKERKKYSSHRAPWGKPVAAGSHTQGYLRAARNSKYKDVENDLLSTRMRCLRSRRGQDADRKIGDSESGDSDLDDFMVTVGNAGECTKKSSKFNKGERTRRQNMATEPANSGDDCKNDAVIEATVQRRRNLIRKSAKKQAASDSDSASNLVVSEEEPEWLPGKKNILKETKVDQSTKKDIGRQSRKKRQMKVENTIELPNSGVKRKQSMVWDEKQKDDVAKKDVGCLNTNKKNKTSGDESCKEIGSPESIESFLPFDQNEVLSKKFSWSSPEKTSRSSEDIELEINIEDQNICGSVLKPESNLGVSSSATHREKITEERKCDDTKCNNSTRTVRVCHVKEVTHVIHSTEESDHKSDNGDLNIPTQYSDVANDKITSSQDCLSVTTCSPVSLLNTNGDIYSAQIPGKILEKRQDPAKSSLLSLEEGKNKLMRAEESAICNAKEDEKEKDATVSSTERTPGLSLAKKNAWSFAAKSKVIIKSSEIEVSDKINCCDRENETGKEKIHGKLNPVCSNEEAREKKIECNTVDGVELLEPVGKSDKRKHLLSSESVLNSFHFHEREEDIIKFKEKRRKVDSSSVDGSWTDIVETDRRTRRKERGRASKNTYREKDIEMHAGAVPNTSTMSDNGSDVDNVSIYGIPNKTRQGTVRMTRNKHRVERNVGQVPDTNNMGVCPICEKEFHYDILVAHAGTCGEDAENT